MWIYMFWSRASVSEHETCLNVDLLRTLVPESEEPLCSFLFQSAFSAEITVSQSAVWGNAANQSLGRQCRPRSRICWRRRCGGSLWLTFQTGWRAFPVNFSPFYAQSNSLRILSEC
jgi:hypothetical protein